MLIGLCGSRCAGRSTVAAYLAETLDFLVVRSPSDIPSDVAVWRSSVRVVISHLSADDDEAETLLKRPYFLLVHVSAPILDRFARLKESRTTTPPPTLSDFIRAHGDDSGPSSRALSHLAAHARLHVRNDFGSVPDLHTALSAVDFLDGARLRPGWDRYFMALACLAGERTNCMKRRVGCVVARDKRVVATGYNGTPSGVVNCCDGGCPRCNGDAVQGAALDLCLCLHAEENAIIEAGRERCTGATLYTNLFPCVLCAKKIVQSGVRRVVFGKRYGEDGPAHTLMMSGGVAVEAFKGELAPNVMSVLDTGHAFSEGVSEGFSAAK